MRFLKANIRYEWHRARLIVLNRFIRPPDLLLDGPAASMHPFKCQFCKWVGPEKETLNCGGAHNIKGLNICPRCKSAWIIPDSYRNRAISALNTLNALLYPWVTNGRKIDKSCKNNQTKSHD